MRSTASAECTRKYYARNWKISHLQNHYRCQSNEKNAFDQKKQKNIKSHSEEELVSFYFLHSAILVETSNASFL